MFSSMFWSAYCGEFDVSLNLSFSQFGYLISHSIPFMAKLHDTMFYSPSEVTVEK